MKKIFLLIALSVSMLGVPMSQAAVDDSGPIEGTLRAVYADSFTVTVQSELTKSSDANLTDMGELTFGIDGQSKFKNFTTLSDLVEGDHLKINYRDQENGRVAVLITKVNPDEYHETKDGMTVTRTTTTTTTRYP